MIRICLNFEIKGIFATLILSFYIGEVVTFQIVVFRKKIVQKLNNFINFCLLKV